MVVAAGGQAGRAWLDLLVVRATNIPCGGTCCTCFGVMALHSQYKALALAV